MRVVFVADTHLHPYAWASMPEIHGDAYRAFDQVVDYCVQTPDVHALIMGGDVFDTSPPADAVQCFLSNLDRLKRGKVLVYAIQGQHGRSDTPWTAIDPYVVHLQGQPITTLEGVCFTGFDQTTPTNIKHQLENLDPNINMLVLHQLCRGTVPDIGGQQTWDLDPAWVPPSVKLVLMGDYHDCWQHETDSALFVYNGSTAVQAIDEPADKSFLSVEVIGPGHFRLARVPIRGRSYWRAVIQVPETLESAITQVQQAPPGSVVHIKYNTDLPDVETALRAANDGVHFMFRPLPKQLVNVEAQIDTSKLKEISLEGCLGMALDREKEKEAHDLTLLLLKSEDPRAALAEAKEHFLQPVPAAEVGEDGEVPF